MQINNNPATSLVPVVLGEIKASRKTAVDSVEAEKRQDTPQQLARVVTEAEKQAAKQQLEQNYSDQQQNLFRDEASRLEKRAIQAFSENGQLEQNENLSQLLGIDVFA